MIYYASKNGDFPIDFFQNKKDAKPNHLPRKKIATKTCFFLGQKFNFYAVNFYFYKSPPLDKDCLFS